METAILEKIGLTPGEIKAYLTLLRIGPSSSGPLSKHSGVSRSKIYAVLDKLEKKGLASHVDKHGVVHFQAVEPSKIKDYLVDRKEELDSLERDFENFLPELQAHQKTSAVQNVTVYQGIKGLRVAHEHTYLKLKRGEEYYVLGIPNYPPWEGIKYWYNDHKRRASVGIKCKLLFNSDVDRKILRKRNNMQFCEARYLPVDIRTPAYFTIYKNTTMIIIPSAEPLTIEIVSQEITDAFREYFEEFWKRATPLR